MLSYDPYLDTNLIPSIPNVSEKDKAKMTPEQKKAQEDLEAKAAEAAKKLREDKLANIIFARHDCVLKDGIALNMDREKFYLFINAPEEFFSGAETKLRQGAKSIKRADPDTEKKVIAEIETERSNAEAGFGALFG